jgi:PAS domain S-box-containing protein
MNITDSQTDSPLILVVDDDKFMRIQLRRAMEQAGYRVAEANDAEEALVLYTDLNPDIVLLDAMLPGMDGFTCCTQIQKLSGNNSPVEDSLTSRTPVLIITALEDQQSVDRAFEVGAIDYITKPIHWAVLRQRVRRVLQASRAVAQLRQQTERVRLSEEHLRLALEAAQMGTWNWDILTGNVIHSATTEAIHGLAPGSFDGSFQGFLRSIHPNDRELVTQALRCTLEEGADYNIEFRVIWPDGSVHWVASKGQVYYDNAGQPIRMTGINMDTTERKQVEEALKASEQRWQLALRGNNDGIWDWNIKTNEAFFSTRWKEMLGYEDYEIGNHLDEWTKRVHPDDLGWVTQVIQDHFAKKTPFYISEYRVLCKDGTYKWILDRGQALWDEQGDPVRMAGSHTDITERKRVEKELERQTHRSQLFAEVTLKIRQSLHIEDILRTTVVEVQRILQSDRVLIFQLRSNGVGKIVTETVNYNWPSVVERNITDECFESEYLEKYSQGRVYTIADLEKTEIPACLVNFMREFNVKAKLAVPILLKEKLWGLLIVHQCSSPRQWSSFETELLGQLADQIGIALAQAQLLEQETRQRQELARSNDELEKFAHIASHDLQEPLRKIQAFGDRLKTKYHETLTDQGRDYLERMQNAASRMQALIDDLLTLSRITTKAQPFVPVDLAQIVQDVLSDLEVRIEETNAQVDVGLLPTIAADPLQMHQLLQNLISNALKFSAKGELPQVKIYSQLLTSEEKPALGNAAMLCQIFVEDSGIGFDEKYLDRIFNIFQRLHGRSEYEGTGIGLAICRKIAERHGGTITAKSTPGNGATFIVTLPLKHHQGENS